MQIRIDRPADGTAHVAVTADNPETLQLLRSEQAELHRTLDHAGVPAEGRTLTFQTSPAPQPASDTGKSSFAGSGQGSGSGSGFAGRDPNGQTSSRRPTAVLTGGLTPPALMGRVPLAAGWVSTSAPEQSEGSFRHDHNGRHYRRQHSIGYDWLVDQPDGHHRTDRPSSNFRQLPDHADDAVAASGPDTAGGFTQFTSELVQFSSVEQQIATNSNLMQLIQLTQASQIEQSSAMLGKAATVTSSQLSLQNSTAQINFTTQSAEPVAITVYNAAGSLIQSTTATSIAGANVAMERQGCEWQHAARRRLYRHRQQGWCKWLRDSGTFYRDWHCYRGAEPKRQRAAENGKLAVPFSAVQVVGS